MKGHPFFNFHVCVVFHAGDPLTAGPWMGDHEPRATDHRAATSKAAISYALTKFALVSLKRTKVHGPSHPTLAARPLMGYNKTPNEAEILA